MLGKQALNTCGGSQQLTVQGRFRGEIVSLTLVTIGFEMAKSSIDYSELSGLTIALSRLRCKSDKSNEEVIVAVWLLARISELNKK